MPDIDVHIVEATDRCRRAWTAADRTRYRQRDLRAHRQANSFAALPIELRCKLLQAPPELRKLSSLVLFQRWLGVENT